MRVFLLAVVALLAAPPSCVTAQGQTTYEDVVAGMRCSQNRSGDLECDYRVGRSLHFGIVAPGKPDGSVYFYSSSFEGEYFAVVSIASGHGCVVVRPGKGAGQGRQLDLAFVSPRSGKVYRTKQECESESGSARPTIIFLDDVSYPDDGAGFAAAFAVEPLCQGLTLTRWTGSSAEKRAATLGARHWFASYSCSKQIDACGGGLLDGTRHVPFSGDSHTSAVASACKIMKGAGGSIK